MGRRAIVWGAVLIGLTGCATVEPDSGFPEVRAAVEERQATTIAWSRDAELEREAADRVQSLLAKPLSADGAVQVAMLNSRELQALYAEWESVAG